MPILHRLQLRGRPIPLIATLIAVAIGISLGNWQTGRAREKIALEQRLASRQLQPPVLLDDAAALAWPVEAIEFRQVRAQGRFLADWPVYLDNRPHDGKAGFYLLMPFQLTHSRRVVWVARGWLARDALDRTQEPAYATPLGETTIAGLAVASPGHVLQLGAASPVRPHAMLQNADLAALNQALQRPAFAFFVEQTDAGGAIATAAGRAAPRIVAPADGLVRDWPKPSLGVDKHRGYALQWYGLALTAFLFFIVSGFRRSAARPEH
jgi:surfeit locus 1 family protein